MKKLMMIAALILGAPLAWAGSDMSDDAAAAAQAEAKEVVSVATDAVEVVDKGTSAADAEEEAAQDGVAAAAE